MAENIKFKRDSNQLLCQGNWNVANLTHLKDEIRKITFPAYGTIIINGAGIKSLDSAGAYLLLEWINKYKKKGLQVELEGFSEQHLALLDIIEKQNLHKISLPELKQPSWLNRVGRNTLEMFDEFIEYLGFIGMLTFEAIRVFFYPRHFRLKSVASIIDKTGFQALPIIALLSFMIGVVLAYQMGNQLRNYGANIFIVNLLGFSVLREFGPLLTAIMVTGRTGSSFTAQLGIMKINQEIDALNTIGVTPGELLLLPRMIGLLISLPLLTIWADFFGILGGMVMTKSMLNIGWHDFLARFQQEIPLRSLIIGLGKAPLFALIIGSIGCYEGMRVANTADSLGRNTTRSVVLGIFFIIVVDAMLSIIFSKLKL